jgi:putative SOS response-associated peptidase YedK
MCGRYSITKPIDAVRRIFGVESAINFPPRYNVAPTQDVPVVRISETGKRELVMLRWGLIPRWAKDAAIGSRLINARAETITEKPSFRDAFIKRRCLVVADGFYEWQKIGEKKQPWRITLASEEPFGFVGLWERWTSPDGPVIESATIITTNANDLCRPIHDRMPAIIAPSDQERWLVTDRSYALLDMLQPYPASEMRAYRVSTAVNNVRNDGPECIAEVAA